MDALCLRELLFDLIIGNIRGARNPNDSDPNWRIVAAIVTRAQAQQKEILKPLKMKEITYRYSVTKEELCRMQNEGEDSNHSLRRKKLLSVGRMK